MRLKLGRPSPRENAYKDESHEGNQVGGYSSANLTTALIEAMKINKIFTFESTKDFAGWLLEPENSK